jgi:hypothetical protein
VKLLIASLLFCGCCQCPSTRYYDRALDKAMQYQDSLKLEIVKLKKEEK